MLKRLKLTNFMQHKALEINFTQGVNVIRGANEAGKSTIFKAVAYAFGGARALPMTLEDTVTWGLAPGSLRVELDFSHAGVDYSIYRAKAGSEMRGGGNTASGQAEVTAAVERVFGINMATAKSIMLADQGNLRGALDDGAVQLIERLSNVGLIDQLVKQVQIQLPCGNTKLIEDTIMRLAGKYGQPPADRSKEAAALDEKIEEAKLQEKALQEVSSSNELCLKELELETKNAAEILKNNEKLVERRSSISKRITLLQGELAMLKPPAEYQGMTVEQLRTAAQAQEDAKETQRVWSLFQTAHATTGSELTEDAAGRICGSYAKSEADLRTSIQRLKTEMAVAASKIVTGSCDFCGKHLGSVAEVQQTNAQITEEIARKELVVQEKEAALLNLASAYKSASLVLAVNAENKKLAKNFPNHIVVRGFPADCYWIGGPVSDGPLVDYQRELARALNNIKAVEAHQTQRAYLLKAIDTETAELGRLEGPLDEHTVRSLKSVQTLLVETALSHKQMQRDLNDVATKIVNLQHSMMSLAKEIAVEQQAYESGQAEMKAQQAAMAEYSSNNDLIRRLREVRPLVAKKLWTSVLSPMSSLLTTVRGELSTVTRDTDRFLINGKPAEAYSGSAKDCLGLVIRIALQKTFTPAVDFLLVDEPAAATDEQRELAMLGLLGSVGYGQVVLITHSNLADTFASNFIQLEST
jgi:DNA repair exonuclease SbcCD ATPase subunit